MSYIPESALPDKSTFTEGTSQLTPVGGEYNTSATTPASGEAAVCQITQNRALHTNLRNSSGTEIATSSNPVRVDPTGTTTQPVSGSVSVSNFPGTQPVSGTVTANAGTGTFTTSDANAVAQGATTSGEKGFLELGAVTTSAPSYTTGQSSPLSLTTAGALRVDASATTQPVSGTVTANAGSGTFATADANAQSQGSTTSGQKGFLELGAVSTSAPSYTNAQSSPLSLTTAGALRVDSSATTQPVSGSVSISGTPSVSVGNTPSVAQSGTWTVQPGNTANTTPWLVQPCAGSGNGWSVVSETALTNTVVTIKSSAGDFGGYMVYNPNASVVYVQVFDAASVTLGTTTPKYVIPLPAGAAANIEFSLGITHANAIKLAATTTPTGSTAPASSLTGFFLYS